MVVAIQQDADKITSEPGEAPEDAFLRAYAPDAAKLSEGEDDEDKKAPPADKDADPKTSEETPEDNEDADEGEDDSDDQEDGGKEPEGSRKRVILEPDADAFVKHKVDGKDVEIPVKDLTRLYGQEAALTRKSQELAEVRKTVDETGARHVAGLEHLLTAALEELKPYADLNFLALSKDPTVSAEDLVLLQKQAQTAFDKVNFLKTGLDKTVADANTARHTNLVKAAQDAWKVLSNPETGIKDWDEKVYNEIRAYTTKQGIPAQTVNELVDPVAIKLLHKAMLYDKGQSASVKVVKVDKEPKRIIKGSTDNSVNRTKPKGAAGAMAKLAETGSVDDAADAFLALMAKP